MKLILLGTGPTEPVMGEGKNRRLNSSALLQVKGKNILIDCSRHFLEQMKEYAGDVKEIDFIILTHGHNDATLGLKDLPEFTKGKVPCFCERQTATRIREDIKEPQVDFFYSEPHKKLPLEIEGLSITPFRVEHSIQPGYPTCGFRIETSSGTIVYSEDVGKVPKDSLRYYDNSDIIIFDAAMWAPKFIKGHFNHEGAMDFLKQFATKKIYLTQAGHTYPPYEEALKKIREYWEVNKGESKAKVGLAYDGMEIDSHSLSKYKGIYLVSPHAEMIWKGEKDLIVKSKMFKFALNKNFYWLDNEYCYGILKLTKITRLTPPKFNELKDRHKITNEERLRWWKTTNKILYGYDFEIVQKFDKPKRVDVPQGIQTFVTDVTFVNENTQELIRDIAEYNPSEANNAQLADDWRIAMSWYASKKSGKKMKFSIEDIVNVAKLIYDEIQRRVKEDKMKHEFKPEDMTSTSKELFGIVSKGVLKKLIKSPIRDYNPSELNNIQLNSDWRQIFAWYTAKRTGKVLKINIEDIINIAKLIYEEIQRRVKTGEMEHEFKPETMKPLPLELFRIVSEGVLEESNQIHATIEGLSPILSEFKDFQIINNFMSIVGSTIKSNAKHMPNDVDLHIRMTGPDNYLKRAIEVRILKMLPEDLAHKIHFVWGDPEGSHDSFCPLYHLALIRAKPDIVEMGESITPLKAFEPMKSSASLGNSLFYKIEDAVAKLAPLKKSLIVEKKYNGFHAFLHKKGAEIKIFTEEKKDVTESFPSLISEVKGLSNFDFIIEGELVPYNPQGETLGRAPLIKYVIGKKPEAMETIVFHVWDLLYFKDKPLTSLELYERKKALNALSFTKHITKVQPIVARNEEELTSAIKKVSKEEGSEGAMIKQWDITYKPGSTTSAYVKCKIQQKIFAVVLEEIKSSATTQVYSVGVYVPVEMADKILDKKLIDFEGKKVMRLGNTFLTSIDATKGDILELGVEEIWRHRQTDTSKLYWSMHKPRVIEKSDRKDTSSLKDLDALVVSGGQEVSFSGELRELNEVPKGEGETRSEAAVEFWKNNWHLMYPKSGKGRFIVHRHWRGLTEEESEFTESELFETDRSVHDDLRCQHDASDAFGFTIFLGATKDNPWPDDKLIALSKSHKPEDKLRGHPKLRIPVAWLDVAKRGPVISEPSGVGATSHKYAKFFAADYGTYEIGVWREHYIELFLRGKSLKGRCNIAYVPTADGRMWMVDFPEDQTPYAQTHKKEDVIKELRSKKQKWLVWRNPADGKPPEKINVEDFPDV